MEKYNRELSQLEEKACKWWPENIVALEADVSIIPKLLQTQDKFLSILKLGNPEHPEEIFNIIDNSNLGANMFLKHLMILTDFGSEPLQRVNRDFLNYFPEKELAYLINGEEINYTFSALPQKGSLTNKKMKTDNAGLKIKENISPLYKDLISLLLFGSNAVQDDIANIFSKCTIGTMLGEDDELNKFVKQRYIFVSRIIGGAQANDLGNAAQIYAEDYLKRELGPDYIIKSNGHIPGITQNGKTETTFDLSIGHNGRYVGIEISFQVTTNSTIERKAGQAKARYNSVKSSGNYIGYIIDGAGNFQRTSALSTICRYSDCTVAYTKPELDLLVKFILEKIG